MAGMETVSSSISSRTFHNMATVCLHSWFHLHSLLLKPRLMSRAASIATANRSSRRATAALNINHRPPQSNRAMLVMPNKCFTTTITKWWVTSWLIKLTSWPILMPSSRRMHLLAAEVKSPPSRLQMVRSVTIKLRVSKPRDLRTVITVFRALLKADANRASHPPLSMLALNLSRFMLAVNQIIKGPLKINLKDTKPETFRPTSWMMHLQLLEMPSLRTNTASCQALL